MSDSIFTRIIKGEIPSYKIFEDDKTLAFLDIHPVQPGHTLVISKKQVPFVWDLPAEDYQAVMRTCQQIALLLNKVQKTAYIGSQIVGVDVPHAHVNLIPFNTPEEFRNLPDMSAEPDHAQLASLAQKLTKAQN